MGRLQGKVAVITGANSGIGRAAAERFIEEGATVVLTGRRPDAVAEAAEALGPQAHGIVADASKLGDIDRLLAEVGETYGRIDVLFLNAGVAPFGPIDGFSEADFDRVFETNVKGPYFTIQRALPLLKEGSSVLVNASVAGVKGLPGTSAYSATKAAVRSLVRGLAAELGPRGIRVNALSPGAIETPIWSKTGLAEEQTSEFGASISQTVPLGRFGSAQEMASVAVFLSSDDASYVTGGDLQADGGFAQV